MNEQHSQSPTYHQSPKIVTGAPASLMSTMVTPPTNTSLPKPNEEVWVENKTADGRVYFYNARTRESAWTRPAPGPNIRIITQEEVERMAAVNNQLQQAAANANATVAAATSANETTAANNAAEASNGEIRKDLVNGKATAATTTVTTTTPENKSEDVYKAAVATPTPAPAAVNSPSMQPFAGHSPFGNGPPPFFPSQPPAGFPPFGMPPPGMFPPGGFPGPFAGMPPPPFAPPFAPPFGMPPFGMPPFGGPGAPPMSFAAHPLDEARYLYSEETKREMKEVEEKMVKAREEAAFYTEHDTPEGKKYYFNSKLNQSFWDKPKCMTELTELEAKFEELKKKRIEKTAEQQQHKNHTKDKENNTTELSEDEKAKQKSKPISSTAVPGTPWCVVWTRDRRVFFYNPSGKISLWERPAILMGRPDVDKLVKECPVAVANNDATNNTPPSASTVNTPSGKKKPSETSNQEPPVKKNKVVDEDENSNSGGGATSPKSTGSNSPRALDNSMSPTSLKASPDEFLQKEKIEASKEAAIEAEHKAAQVRAQLPLEQRLQQFKELLIEKDVSAYSTWEKELQKIVFDPRYLLLTSKERKQVFEKYVRDRANQESKEKSAALKKKKDDYRDLLKEAAVSAKNANFADFSSRFGRDERFKAIEKMKDRESLFNDYLSELRKQEKEEKQHSEKEQRKKSYLAMLKELRHLHKHSSWTETKKLLENDPRYKAIESSSKREDYFRDYCKYLDEKPSSSSHNGDSKSRSDKHDKRSDKHKSSGDEKRQSSKDKDKDKERDKKESNKMEQDVEEEETNGRDHHRSSRTATEAENGKEEGEANDDEEMQEAETLEDEEERRKEKEKQERVEASLRERNKEVKEQLSKLHSEREKERQQLKKDELVESFKALLIDLIKTNLSQPPAPSAETSASNSSSSSSKPSELTWKEAKKILKRDSRWSYCKPLEKEKKEALFDEHMNKFRAKKRDLFYQLLDDTAASISLKSSTWKEVKKMIKADPRYEKIQQSDSFKMEKEFEVYLNERFQKSKDDFKELLAQTKLITYKTHTTLKEQPGHMKELEELLSNDKSWIVLNCAPEERKQMLLEYIEQLNKDGPPPPPTATEPTKPRVK